MKAYLKQLIDGATLTRQQAHDIMLAITRQQYCPEQIAALLMAIQTRGVTVDELLGLRDGLMETGRQVDLDCPEAIDIVGTGGDGKNTFNVSTCAAFVVAGAGFKVTKHGNGASTSVSGASNVLAAHGVQFTDDEARLRRSLDASGVCYLHAPLFAHGMKFVGPVRRALGVPTCFNLLGPLVNPSQPRYSLHGTATQAQLRLYTQIHQRLGDNYGIVTSVDGYDEVSLTSDVKYVSNTKEVVFSPEQIGLPRVLPEQIYGGNTAAEATQIFDNVLGGTATAAQTSVVIANAACAIGVLRPSMSIADTVALARESIESGRAMAALKTFVEVNQ